MLINNEIKQQLTDFKSEFAFINYFYENFIIKKQKYLLDNIIERAYLSFFVNNNSYVPLFLFFKYDPDLLIKFVKNNNFGKFIINDIFSQRDEVHFNKFMNEILFSENLINIFQKNDFFYDLIGNKFLIKLLDDIIINKKLSDLHYKNLNFSNSYSNKNIFNSFPFDIIISNHTKLLNIEHYDTSNIAEYKQSFINYLNHQQKTILTSNKKFENFNSFIYYLVKNFCSIKYIKDEEIYNSLNYKKYLKRNNSSNKETKFDKFINKIYRL